MTTSSADSLRVLFQDALEMLALTRASFRRHDAAALAKAETLGRDVHLREKELTQRFLATPAAAAELRFIPGPGWKSAPEIAAVSRSSAEGCRATSSRRRRTSACSP